MTSAAPGGCPRSRAEILAEYQRYHAALLRLNPAKRDLIARRDAPELRHRWSVTLDCGCVTECLTRGDRSPADGSAHRLFTDGLTAASHVFVINASLNAGRYLRCIGHGSPPISTVTEWIAPREEWNRRMIAWEPVGPLTWPGDDAQPSRQARKRQLHETERRASELRELLALVEAEQAELRDELAS